jgi:hypothetical protein
MFRRCLNPNLVLNRRLNGVPKLTEDILDVTKIECGSLLLKKEKFDLCMMIKEILGEYQQNIKDSSSECKFVF